MEAFLTLCDDAEADVRMVADECLNRTIKVSNNNDEDHNYGYERQSFQIHNWFVDIL